MIREATLKDKKIFDKLANHPLQTWEWGDFRAKTGNKIYRFIQFKNKKPIRVFTITIHKIPKIKYHIGALIKCDKIDPEVIKFLISYSKKHNIVFTKTEINTKKDNTYIKFLKQSGFKKGKNLFTPTTFIINLQNKTENELLSSFHSKTRYNIKKAIKEGVEIHEDNSQKSFDKYLSLTKETVERQKFFAHSQNYHKTMWSTLNPKIAKLFVAIYKNEIITTWILFKWKDTLYYPYGASTHKYKNVMANNLMLWESIKYAKKQKLKYFDLWGREEGKGFTNFKLGYNPEIFEFIGTWDLVIDKNLYATYLLVDKIRWFILKTKSKFIKPKF